MSVVVFVGRFVSVKLAGFVAPSFGVCFACGIFESTSFSSQSRPCHLRTRSLLLIFNVLKRKFNTISNTSKKHNSETSKFRMINWF